MLIKNILMVILGIIFGSAISSGLFALVNSIKLLPNFADKTHTKHCANIYETAILIGATSCNVIYFLKPDLSFPLSNVIIGIVGFFIGVFVGSFALSLAEKLSLTAIISRRFRLHSGMGFLLLSMALGKLFGNIIYFMLGWFYS